jgi:hypothetical protein
MSRSPLPVAIAGRFASSISLSCRAALRSPWDCRHLVRADAMQASLDIMVFKDGIRPMWEDEANARGGQWKLRVKKGVAAHFWEELLLALVGEQFDVGNEVCGAVLSIRFHDDSVSVWNRNADNEGALNKIRCVGGCCGRKPVTCLTPRAPSLNYAVHHRLRHTANIRRPLTVALVLARPFPL